MKILKIISLWQLFKLTAIVLIVYVSVHYGIAPAIIGILLLVRLAFGLILKLIGGIMKIAALFLILWILTLIL